MKLRFSFCAAFGLTFFASAGALAGDCSGSASGCIPSDSFWPAAGVGDFAWITSPAVRERRIGFGLHTSYLLAPVVARVPSPGIPTDVRVVEHQLVVSPFISYAPFPALEIATTLPASGQSGSGVGVLSGQGTDPITLRDARLDFRLDGRALLAPRGATLPVEGDLERKSANEDVASTSKKRGREWRYGAHAVLAFPIAAPKNFSGDRTLVFAPTVMVQRDEGDCFFGSEFGARLRGVTEFAGARLGPQVIVSFGLGCDLLKRRGEAPLLAFSLEGVAMPTFVDQTVVDPSGRVGNRVTPRPFVPAEWLFALRSAVTSSLDLRLAAGGALGGWTGSVQEEQVTGGGSMGTSMTTPRFRGVLSIAYHIDPPP